MRRGAAGPAPERPGDFHAATPKSDAMGSITSRIISRSPGRSRRRIKINPTRAKTAFGIHIATPTGSFCCLAKPLAAIRPIQ